MLIKSEHLDDKQKLIFLNWCNKNNVKKCENDEWNKKWFKIIPNIRNIDGANECPNADYRDIFVREDGSKIWTIQPYCKEEEFEKTNAREWAKQRGLSVKIDKDCSWHYVESTIIVQFGIEDMNKLNEYLKNNKRSMGARSFYLE